MSQSQVVSKPSGDLASSLLQVNRLMYKMAPEIGITRHKTHQVDLPQQSTYTAGQQMIFEAQTGSAFIDAGKSWLQFTIQTAASGASVGSFGVGSALNCIQDSLVLSRTGVELSRMFNVNLYQKYKDDWYNCTDWATAVGPSQGYAVTDLLTNALNFCIPLKKISPFFDQKKLLPPQIMEGMRIRLDLAGLLTAIVDADATPDLTGYTITNPEIHWSTVHLADAFRRKVAEMSASRGLVLLHKEVYHQQTSGTATAYNFEIRKAASKALACHTIPRLVANVGVSTQNADAMSSEIFNFANAQSHIGSDYFPQQALTGTVANFNEFYAYSLQAHGKLCAGQAPPNVIYGSAAGNYGSSVATNSKASIAWDLNKSGVTDLDGYVINNSRALVVDVTMVNSSARRFDSFLEHLRAVKVYPSNAEVKD